MFELFFKKNTQFINFFVLYHPQPRWSPPKPGEKVPQKAQVQDLLGQTGKTYAQL